MRFLALCFGLAVTWVLLAAPGFGGGGGFSGGIHPVNSRGGGSDSPETETRAKIILGIFGVGWVGLFGYLILNKPKLTEITFSTDDAADLVPKLDQLAKSSSTATALARKATLNSLLDAFAATTITDGWVGETSNGTAPKTRRLYIQRMTELGIAPSPPTRDSASGSAVVGLILGTPKKLNLGGDRPAIPTALDKLRGMSPTSLYVYYLPDPGKALTAEDAKETLKQIAASL